MELTEEGFREEKLLQTVKRDFHSKRVTISLLLSYLKTRRLYRWRKAKFGLTAEYPSTPKEILKSVATRLHRHAECRLSYRGHVEFEDGYAATHKT